MDVLDEPDALRRWGRRLGVLSPRARVVVTDTELASARNLRATIHEVFAAVAAGDHPSEEAVDRLRAVYAEAVRVGRMRSDDESWALTWPDDDARSVRYAAVADAMALLAEPARFRRVRQCPGRNCGGLFVDVSGQRKWCSMEACGSRAKMRRLYERRRDASGRG
jgi:predicted RNA-binding Zn ribbon-like protein